MIGCSVHRRLVLLVGSLDLFGLVRGGGDRLGAGVVSPTVVVALGERGDRARHRRHAVDELCAVDHVGVAEHALLERDDDELRLREVCLDHAADVLRVAEIQRRVHLVQDIDGRGLEHQQREDEAEGEEGALPAAQLRQGLLPHRAEGHLDLQAIQHAAALRGLQLGHGARQQGREDGPEVLVHLLPRGFQRQRLLLVQLANHLLDLSLVFEHDGLLVDQLLVLALRLVEHAEHLLVHLLGHLLVRLRDLLELRERLLRVARRPVVGAALHAEEMPLALDPGVLREQLGHALCRLRRLLLQPRQLVLRLLRLHRRVHLLLGELGLVLAQGGDLGVARLCARATLL
mmetsp:Transcript_45018/g.75101  ORF Transcript_45018/g.75101 Transcript_45018/m.75101 type:complete len:345 (+) Transcript_45018:383-1417(+)